MFDHFPEDSKYHIIIAETQRQILINALKIAKEHVTHEELEALIDMLEDMPDTDNSFGAKECVHDFTA